MSMIGKWLRTLDVNDGDTGYTVNQRGSGAIADLQAGGVSKFKVTAAGVATVGGDTICTLTATQTLSAKTLTTPIIASLYQVSGGGLISLPASAGADTVCLLGATQSLAAKTLTSAVLETQATLKQATANYTLLWSDPAVARNLTIPDPLGHDSFVFLAAAQTLTSKTLTAPTINGTVATTGLTLPALTLGGAVAGGAQNITSLGSITGQNMALGLTVDVAANSQSINAAIAATTLTAANTKSFTGVGANIVLPAITPAANGAGITLTGLNITQGAIGNVADSEAITVTMLRTVGAAGVVNETGVYAWVGHSITMPAQAANAAVNTAIGLQITGGAAAGGAGAYQRGVSITMNAAADRAINVTTGATYLNGSLEVLSVFWAVTTGEFLRANAVPQRFFISTATDANVPVVWVNANGQINIESQGTQAIRLNVNKGGILSIHEGLTLHLTRAVTANSDSLNAAPTAMVLTAANAKSFTGVASNISLPAITPAANGAGITLTGLNLTQGAIGNVADSEAITIKQIIITGAAGAALETGVYSWTGVDITTPAQAANGVANVGIGLKITGGALAGVGGYQQGIAITMAAATDDAINVTTGRVTLGGPIVQTNANATWGYNLNQNGADCAIFITTNQAHAGYPLVAIFNANLNATDGAIQVAGGDGYSITQSLFLVKANGNVLLGRAGLATGVLAFGGATSGTVTVTVAATAGTWTMTLPAAVGTAGYFLRDVAGDGITGWSNTLPAVTEAAGYLGFTEMAAPGAGGANTARIYAVVDGGALTDLAAVFQDGTVDIFAQEVTALDSPIFTHPSRTKVEVELRKPHAGKEQFVAIFPDGKEFVLREFHHHTPDKVAASMGAEAPAPAGWLF